MDSIVASLAAHRLFRRTGVDPAPVLAQLEWGVETVCRGDSLRLQTGETLLLVIAGGFVNPQGENADYLFKGGRLLCRTGRGTVVRFPEESCRQLLAFTGSDPERGPEDTGKTNSVR